MTQSDRADRFHQLHTQAPFVLLNAWDAPSAKVMELAGAPAVATTSAGVAWANALCDGETLSREVTIAGAQSLIRTVDIPVSVDIESGYGHNPEDVAVTVERVLEAGAVGINLEDAPGTTAASLIEPERQADRIQAAREVAQNLGVNAYINARTDIYLRAIGPADARLEAVLERAEVYLKAGADGIFVPGTVDEATVERLAADIEAPLNVMVGAGGPAVARLGELGVARISLGPALALSALGHLSRVAQELLTSGACQSFEQGPSYPEVNGWFKGA